MNETQDAAAGSAPSERARVTQRLGRFLLLRALGEGGMGTVFAAYDEQLDRKVAVKLLHPRGLEDGTQRQRVLREAQAMARVSHPHVIHVYEVGELGSQIFIAMEYIDGMTLAERQERRQESWRAILDLYMQAGQGLLAAHRTGLVHRDFKPENVLVDKDGCARVADFGLARLQGDTVPVLPLPMMSSSQPILASPLTATGTISGTPAYMAPEQFRGDAVDSRSDQFSFCVALYEALYKQRPFAGESVPEIASEVITGRVRPIPQNSLVPIEIWKALSRGLARDPQQRFSSMEELLAALDIDGENDPAGARRARTRFSAIIGLVTVLLGSTALLRLNRLTLTMQQMTVVMGIAMLMLASATLAYRKSLLNNSFHRGLTRLALVCVGTMLGVRAMAWHMGLDILLYYPVDLILMAGTFALYASHFLPRLWGAVAILVAAALASAHWPQRAHQIANLMYICVPFAVIHSWYLRAMHTPGSAAPESDRRLLLSTRSRSSRSK